MEIRNSIALVSGANRGIGRAFVEELLEAGAAKIYATARNPESLADLVSTAPDKIIPVELDVIKPGTIEAAKDGCTDVTLLINNAGIAEFEGLISATDIAAARGEMETNYFGVLNMTRAFAPILSANGGGAIVNMASIASLVNFPMIGSYSASKAAVHSLTQGIRAELTAQCTLVVGVYPGPIDTDMAARFPMDTTAPSVVAKAVFAAVEAGEEDVYPDPVSAEMHAGLLGDPKGTEKQLSEMLPQ